MQGKLSDPKFGGQHSFDNLVRVGNALPLIMQGCTACYLADMYEVMQECTELLVHALALHGCAAVVLCIPAQGAAAGGSVQGKQRWVNPSCSW